MKYLAQFLLGAFGELFKAFGFFVSKKVALLSAAASISLFLLTGFYVSMKMLVAGLMYQISNDFILMGFWLIWPSNAELCLSTYWSAMLTAFLYREYKANLRRALQ